jgi:hypothetical protein
MQSIDSALEVLRQQYETTQAEAAARARRELTAELNQFARRLLQYGTEQEFTRALIDGATMFASGVAFFSAEAGSLLLRAEAGLGLNRDLRFPIDAARSFAQAVASKEIVVALRTASEVGEALALDRSERAVILPVQNSERVAGVLFASADADVQGLELITGFAALALSRKQPDTKLAQLKPESAPAPKSRETLPPWSALKEEQRNLHWRAQRFARVKVSEWLLIKPEACRAGLEQNDIYLFLKKEIEAARESFRDQFMGDKSMVDYLHLEMVAAMADGNESRLGVEYQGPLA